MPVLIGPKFNDTLLLDIDEYEVLMAALELYRGGREERAIALAVKQGRETSRKLLDGDAKDGRSCAAATGVGNCSPYSCQNTLSILEHRRTFCLGR